MSLTPAYRYISAEELAELIKAKPASEVKQYAVVDVRDDDFVGGNIVSAVNVPSNTFHDNVQGLVKRLDTVPKVIFRKSYLVDAVAKEQTVRSHKLGDPKRRACVLARLFKATEATAGLITRQIYAETRQELSPDAAPQEVLVLRDGFSGFQSRYRNDPELVEKFNKFYHD